MKKILILLVMLVVYSLNSFAQNDEMKKWMDYMTPGKEHAQLAKDNGEWTYISKMWMDPNAPPQTFEGTATCEMIFGGRYQQMKTFGNFMGMDFTGMAITGFDNGKKIWFSTWIDNMGTGIMYTEGKYDEASKKLVFTGKMYDPTLGKDTDVKQTLRVIDDKNMEMEMFTIVDGKDVKNMELKYTRK